MLRIKPANYRDLDVVTGKMFYHVVYGWLISFYVPLNSLSDTETGPRFTTSPERLDKSGIKPSSLHWIKGTKVQAQATWH